MGTSKIRLVAVDMDGTLLNRERKITQYTQNVIRRAVSQGVVFAPATGRAVNALPVSYTHLTLPTTERV